LGALKGQDSNAAVLPLGMTVLARLVGMMALRPRVRIYLGQGGLLRRRPG